MTDWHRAKNNNQGLITKLFSGRHIDESSSDETDSLDDFLVEESPHPPTDHLCMYEKEHGDPSYSRLHLNKNRVKVGQWGWSESSNSKLIPPVMEKRRRLPVRLTSDYTPQRIREKGPRWFVESVVKQLDKDPMSLDHVGNIAVLIIKSFPLVIFNKRASKSGRKTTEMIRQIMANQDISDNALLDIIIDVVNSRAAKKIFRDLNAATGLRTLPVVFVNEKAVGNYDALKRSNKVGALLPLIKNAVKLDLNKCKDCDG